jgi:cytoskeleton protein RodZ
VTVSLHAIEFIQREGSLIVGQFGAELRKERESRGIPLETISEKTKVITRYLRALEEDNFKILPGGILGKGIVRGYARAVGIDEAVWVDRFLAATQDQTHPEDDWTEFVRNVSRTRNVSSDHSMRRRWTGLAVVVFLLMGIGLVVWRSVSDRVMADEVSHRAVTTAASATTGNQ